MQDHTITLIVAVAGIAGTFGSGFFTQWMSRASQEEQWLRDRRKEELRELVTVLSDAQVGTLEAVSGRYQEDVEQMGELYSKALRTINDRIYIAAEVRRLNVKREWLELTTDFSRTTDRIEFIKRTDRIISALVDVATNSSSSLGVLPPGAFRGLFSRSPKDRARP